MDELARQLSEVAPKAAEEILRWGDICHGLVLLAGLVFCAFATILGMRWLQRRQRGEDCGPEGIACLLFAAVGLVFVAGALLVLYQIANYPLAYILEAVR